MNQSTQRDKESALHDVDDVSAKPNFYPKQNKEGFYDDDHIPEEMFDDPQDGELSIEYNLDDIISAQLRITVLGKMLR